MFDRTSKILDLLTKLIGGIMKSNFARLFSAALIAVVIISAVPAQSAVKKPAPKVKTGAVCPKPIPKKAVVKSAVKRHTAVKTKSVQSTKITKKLPRLLDLGATKCIPCKMMTPILDQLGKEYKGKLKVEFIDVWKNGTAKKKYNIQTIPTQIFYDANGKEFYRHIGFYPKEDILAKFKEHGIKLKK